LLGVDDAHVLHHVEIGVEIALVGRADDREDARLRVLLQRGTDVCRDS